jgi:hypothetical protein
MLGPIRGRDRIGIAKKIHDVLTFWHLATAGRQKTPKPQNVKTSKRHRQF